MTCAPVQLCKPAWHVGGCTAHSVLCFGDVNKALGAQDAACCSARLVCGCFIPPWTRRQSAAECGESAVAASGTRLAAHCSVGLNKQAQHHRKEHLNMGHRACKSECEGSYANTTCRVVQSSHLMPTKQNGSTETAALRNPCLCTSLLS